MQVGDNVRIEINGEEKFGQVIKLFTQIGYENHGKEMVVILLHDSYLRFYEAEIEILNTLNGTDDPII